MLKHVYCQTFLKNSEQTPILGLTVRLEDVPLVPEGYKLTSKVEDNIYRNQHIIDFVSSVLPKFWIYLLC